MRRLSLVVLLFVVAALCQSCASILTSYKDTVVFEGGAGPLGFYDSAGSPIKAEHEYYDSTHFNYIELDRSIERHTIVATDGNRQQTFTLEQKINYWWILGNANTYGLGAIFDYFNSAIFYFPDQYVNLDRGETAMYPGPNVRRLEEVKREKAERARIADERKNVLLSFYCGLFSPVYQVPTMFTSAGASLGYKLSNELYLSAGYEAGGAIHQEIGPEKTEYNTSIVGPQLLLHYYPIRQIFVSAGPSYNHLHFKRIGSKNGIADFFFTQNLPCFSIGTGFNFGGFTMEWRRYFGLERINTPDGPDHAIALSQVRIGGAIRMGLFTGD